MRAVSCGGLSCPREKPVQRQQVRKRKCTESAAGLHQEFAARCDWKNVRHINCNKRIRWN